MVVVTVARKPLSEPTVATSVLSTGVGAINVDGSRISTSGNEPDSGAMFYKNRGLVMPENRHNYFGGEDGVALSTPIDGGRWPANLVLQHGVGCRATMSRGAVRAERRAKDVGSDRHDGRESYRLKVGVQGAPRGREGEAVTEWDCEPGCPVSALDGQSGVVYSSAGAKGRQGRHDAGSVETRPPRSGTEGVRGHSDIGGASRYFKRVK